LDVGIWRAQALYAWPPMLTPFPETNRKSADGPAEAVQTGQRLLDEAYQVPAIRLSEP